MSESQSFAKDFIEATEEMYREWLVQNRVKSLPDYEDGLERVKREGLAPTSK